MGVVTPFGLGTHPFCEGLRAGRSAARPITRFDASLLPTRFAASLELEDRALDEYLDNPKAGKTLSRAGKFALIAAQEAVRQTGIDWQSVDPYRAGIVLGNGGLGASDIYQSQRSAEIFLESASSANDVHSMNAAKLWARFLEELPPLSPLQALPNIPAAHISIQYNLRGQSQTIATACTSSAEAIGTAYRSVKNGILDIAFTGGTDSLISPNGLIAFSALGVLSRNNEEFTSASRPFDKRRDGFMIGEGAAVFVLESMERAERRGARILGEIAGFGSAADAYRLTDEPADAHGSVHAMQMAIEDAGIDPSVIDYINVHGTGTRINDRTETFAVKQVFGKNGTSIPPLSSTKSMIGHLVAAAGAVECAACLIGMHDNFMPPTINYKVPDPDCDLDYVSEGARPAQLNYVLSNSFGFGGQNAALVLKHS
jgi:3-oxoacyl-[acyl-carrier-protein] synthase II